MKNSLRTPDPVERTWPLGAPASLPAQRARISPARCRRSQVGAMRRRLGLFPRTAGIRRWSLDILRVWRISFVGNFVENFVEKWAVPTKFNDKVCDNVTDKMTFATASNWVHWATGHLRQAGSVGFIHPNSGPTARLHRGRVCRTSRSGAPRHGPGRGGNGCAGPCPT